MTSSKTFQRRKEDFSCEQCGFFMEGSGYTNHCSKCLYSKHVDVFPGDRLESCGGLMEPTAVVKEQGQEKIVHQCVRCGKIRNNKVQEDDDFNVLLEVARKKSMTV